MDVDQTSSSDVVPEIRLTQDSIRNYNLARCHEAIDNNTDYMVSFVYEVERYNMFDLYIQVINISKADLT